MAYLSDIDLATLHKKRLDEKHHYKLSFYNRRTYNDEMSHEQQRNVSLKHGEHKVKSKVGTAAKATTKAKAIVNTKTPSGAKPARASNDENSRDTVTNRSWACDSLTNGNRNRAPDFYDEGYFSSPTLYRRRSGSWP